MNSLTRNARIAAAWLASFTRHEWKPEHYPIEVRAQVNVPPEAAWCARVLNWPGPVGLGVTEGEARASLMSRLGGITASRLERGERMPRPGARVPIQFASTVRVSADRGILDEFIGAALGFRPEDPVFISDESSLCDFGDDTRVQEIRQRIQEHYGFSVTEPEPVRIADLLDRIQASREV